jgi:hypothetical protein
MNVLTALLHIYFCSYILDMDSTEVFNDVVLMPKKAFKKEHKKLTKLLGRTQKELKKEASEQKKEMKEVLSGGMFSLRRHISPGDRSDSDDEEEKRRRAERLMPKQALPARINRRREFYVGVLHQLFALRLANSEEISRNVIEHTYGKQVLEDVLALEAAFTMARMARG